MTELEYKLTNDILFKMMFVKYPGLLKKLVAELLKIRLGEIEKFEIRNPETPPDTWGEKFCRLDINLEVNGQRVDLEVQVEDDSGHYPERALYYWAREFSSALPAGGRYANLPRTVIISIVGFKMFPCEEYYSEYQSMEVKRHELLSDKMGLVFCELPKLPKAVTADNKLELWLSLFRAKTEEELASLEALEVPEMKEAITAYRQITVTPEFREAERIRARARHDEAQAVYAAENRGRQEGRQEGIFDVARSALQMSMPVDDIIKLTGLTLKEVEDLRS